MSLLSKQIANLFNGVSQQTPALRLPSQADAQENCMSSPVEGLHKRAPTEHVAKIVEGTLSQPLIHTINRDKSEQYQVIVSDGDLKVFDLKGNSKTVLFPNGKDYLTSATPRTEVKALTVEDYTFVVNRNFRPALSVTPYLATDRVVCTVNFGDGTLGAPVSYPLRPNAKFAYAYQDGFTSSNNPDGWTIAGNFSTREAAMAAFVANVESHGGVVSQYTDGPQVKNIAGQPDYIDTGTSGPRRVGIQITNKMIVQITSPGAGLTDPYDPGLVILYTTSDALDLNTLRTDVGYPTTPFHVPGYTEHKHLVPAFDGLLYVQVNGTLFSKGFESTWSAEDYLAYFQSQITNTFPALSVDVSTGYQLVIKAPAGEQVFVSAWDTNHRGYVNAVYSDLPIQEAVFVVIENGVPEQTYSVSLGGRLYSVTATNSDNPNGYKIDTLATNLASEINAGGIYQAAVYGNFIKIIDPTGATMTFATHDTYNDTAMYGMKNRVQAFEDLPAKFVPGHPIEVVGTDGTSGFYVHYTQKGGQPPKAYGLDSQVKTPRLFGVITPAGNTWNAVEGEETGLYEECAKPGTPDVLIPGTMPHVLVSNADGTFTFKEVDWFKRSCGDTDSVPAPSFVGKEIADVFFHRNRLGFLTSETVLFSRAGEFFNFWAQTARDVLDSDPIDVQVNHTRVATLRHTAVFNNQLLLFSDNTQFVISAQQILSPKTIAVQPSTEFDCSALCKPVTVGQAVNFISETEDWASCWEYYVETNSVANTAQNVTAHVPKYIPQGVFKLAASSSEDILVALTDGDPSALYVYKFLWGAEGKLQQSWSRWSTQGEILDVSFVDSTMVFTVQHADGVYIEKLSLKPNKVDNGLNFLVCLDRKVRSTGVLTNGKYVHTLPYDATGVTAVSVSKGASVSNVSAVANVVTLDIPEAIFGFTYQSLYRFSPVYMQDKDNTPILGSSLMLKSWALSYENSLDFTLEVTPEKRATHRAQFKPRATGINMLLGSLEPASGVFRVPVFGEGKSTAIQVVNNSHFPMFIQSVHWEANYTIRARRS